MSNSINVTAASASKINEITVSSTVKSAQSSLINGEPSDLVINSESFSESIKTLYGELKNKPKIDNSDKNDKEISGNDLPDTDNYSALSVQNDRVELPAGLHLNERLLENKQNLKGSKIKQTLSQYQTGMQIQTEIKAPVKPLLPVIEAELNIKNDNNDKLNLLSTTALIPPSIDEKISTDNNKISELPAQPGQIIAAEKETSTKNLPSINNNISNNTVSSLVSNVNNNVTHSTINNTETLPVSLSPDKKASTDNNKINELPVQPRQLLATEKEGIVKNIQSTVNSISNNTTNNVINNAVRNIISNTEIANNQTEKTLVLQSKSLLLKAEPTVLTDDKFQTLLAATKQPTSLSLATDSAQIDVGSSVPPRTNSQTNLQRKNILMNIFSTTQQPEISPLNTNPIVLTSDKVQTFFATTDQQQLLPDNQITLLRSIASTQIDTSSGVFPQINNMPANNFSAMNLPSVAPQIGAEIAEAFGKPAWAQGMGKQVLLMLSQNINTAEIRLNPAHLGPIEVLIDMSDEQVTVSMSSRHAVVRDAMELALPKLREMLEQNGFSLADTDISKRSFAEQREQYTKNASKGIATNMNNQLTLSDVEPQAVKPITVSTNMIDYYI